MTADEFQVRLPSPARMYDYYLGGKDNFAADRTAAEKVIAATDDGVRIVAKANRAFLARAVRTCVDAGATQVVDVGTGIPTTPSVYEVAGPGTRVVGVDNDPIVLSHDRALVADSNDHVRIVEGDVTAPEAIIAAVTGLIDFDRPVVLVLGAVLHFVSEPPYGPGAQAIIDTFGRVLVPGSHLVVSHILDGDSHAANGVREAYTATSSGITYRTADEIAALFADYDLLDPGITDVQDWRPDGPPEKRSDRIRGLCAVGRRR